MTETDAKTKWCPMVRFTVTASDDLIDNRPNDRYSAYCIGSACMMWRITYPQQPPIDHTDKYFPSDEGYCGLAGKP